MKWTLKHLKKILIFTVGISVCCIGIALLVLPGPGILTLASGLGILSLEFLWARRWFKKIKTYSKDQFQTLQKKLDPHQSSHRK